MDKTRHDGRDAKCFECRRVKDRKILKGRVSGFIGCKHTEEARAKMRSSKLGKPSLRLGKKHTRETIDKIISIVREKTPRGAKCHSWKGGVTPLNKVERKSTKYADWRRAVFERDNYTCQHCSDARGGNLNAHHIKDFANHPALRYDITNGITLCKTCHDAVHTGVPRIRRVS